MKNLLLLLSLCLCFSCKKASPQNNRIASTVGDKPIELESLEKDESVEARKIIPIRPQEQKPVEVAIKSIEGKEVSAAEQSKFMSKSAFDMVEIDRIRIPNKKPTFNLLHNGAYHGEEVWDNAAKQNWIGLFYKKEDQSYFLQACNITVEKNRDEIVDEEGEETGKKISNDVSPACELLIADINLPEGEVKLIRFANPQPKSYTEPLTFEMHNITYTLFAKGAAMKDKHNTLQVKNYKLYLKAEKDGELITQLLCAQPFFDEEGVSIEWASDIDGDGLPDFLINTTNHYNKYQPTLYLSSKANAAELVRLVAYHVSVGC